MSPRLGLLLGRLGGTLLVVLVVVLGLLFGALAGLILGTLAVGPDPTGELVKAWANDRPLLVTALGWLAAIPGLILLGRKAFGLELAAMGLRPPPRAAPRRPRFVLGVGCGLLLILVPAVLARLFGGFVPATAAEIAALSVPTGLAAIPAMIFLLPPLMLAAVGEEVLFRGLLLRFWEPVAGAKGALVLTALMFAAIHVGNPGSSVLGAVGVILSGLMLGLIFLLRGDLWLASGVHLGWNLAEAMVLGVPVSGHTLPALLRWSVADSDVARGLLGGSFGPEEGLLFHGSLALGIVVTIVLSRGPKEPSGPTDEEPAGSPVSPVDGGQARS